MRDLAGYKKKGYRILLLSGSRTRAKRLAEDLQEQEISAFYTEDPMREVQPGEVMTYYGRWTAPGSRAPPGSLCIWTWWRRWCSRGFRCQARRIAMRQGIPAWQQAPAQQRVPARQRALARQ